MGAEFDAAAHSNLLSQINKPTSGGSGGGGDSTGKDIGTHDFSRVVHNLAIMCGIGGFLGVNVGSAGSHGGSQQGLERGAVTDKMILEGGLATGPKGGVLADLIAKIFNKEGLSHGVSALQWTEVPIEALGHISPPETPGGRMDAGISYGNLA